MNARELAAELATLEKSQREQLLAELPAAKRSELQRLIRELQPLLATPSAFESMMADLKRESAPAADFLTNEARLSQLLRAETVTLKRQLIDVLVGGQATLITAHVRELIVDYLEQQAAYLPAPPAVKTRRKTGWRRFWNS